MLKIGLAGVGVMGQLHLRNYLSYPQGQVVALADLDEDRRQGKLGQTQGNLDQISSQGLDLGQLRSFGDYNEICRADGIDVLAVCLPTDLHADAAIKALESGKHVFCEKPMAMTPSDARRMIQAARSNKRKLMVGHVLRFWPEYMAAGEIIASGKYGKALAASFVRCSGRMGRWFAQPLRSGGTLLDLHIHDADLCVAWWGKPKKIETSGAFYGDSPDIIHSRWQYKDGPSVLFESSWECVKSSPFFFGFKVTMEKATLMLDSRSGKGLLLATEEGVQPISVSDRSGYLEEDHYFLDCVRNNKPVDRCPPKASLLTIECMTKSHAAMAKANGREPLFR